MRFIGQDPSTQPRRNLIINGAMQVWQRGTSAASVSANTYPAADRWKFWVGGTSVTTSQVSFGVGQTDVPNFQYFNRITVGSNSGASDYTSFNQLIENVTFFENRQVTLSFYAKASTPWTVGIEPIQNFGTGGSPSSRVLMTPVTVSVGTTWARHTLTITLPSISGKTLGTNNDSSFELTFWLTGGSDFNSRTGSIGNQSGTFEITGVQLELGSVATPFEHRRYGEELALCQRYFSRTSVHSQSAAAGNHLVPWFAPVRMRTSPSLSVFSAGAANYASATQDVVFGESGGFFQINASAPGGYLLHRTYSLDAEL